MKTHHKIYVGDGRKCLTKIEHKSVNTCTTSPPYWGLRDYKTDPLIWDGDSDCEHEWGEEQVTKGQYGMNKDFNKRWNNYNGNKKKQEECKPKSLNQGSFCQKCGAWKGSLGLEPTFDLYIKHLCDIFDEVKSVLRDDGTCWVNLGDTYSNSGGMSNPAPDRAGGKAVGTRGTQPSAIAKGGFERPKNDVQSKCLLQIPSRFSIEMTNRGWILRNTIIWHKNNCMPSSASDRFTVDFEYLFFFSKSEKYYFEQQFEEYTKPLDRWGGDSLKANGKSTWDNGTGQSSYRDRNMRPNELGRNKRTVWNINTKPFPGSHFAVFPEELIETPIKAGCPEFICDKCGKPREKIYEDTGELIQQEGHGSKTADHINASPTSSLRTKKVKEKKSVGYTNCKCNAGFHPGTVLDPFAGSGTTGKEAKNQGKNSILIELNPDYIPMIIKRLDLESQDTWKKHGIELDHTYEIIRD